MKYPLSECPAGDACFEVSIEREWVIVTSEVIAKSLGYGENGIPEYFGKIISGVIEAIPARCSIRAGYRICDIRMVSLEKKGFQIGDTFLSTDRIIAAQMNSAEKAVLFACTIGEGMEIWSRTLMGEGDVLKAHFVDTVASAAVEKVADILHEHIKRKMQQWQLITTNRFSPGYCGWPVVQQHVLFSFLPPGFCGIRLTDSALMMPVKSVSGVIGAGEKVRYTGYFCDRCNRTACTYRAYKQAKKEMEELNER
jgi:hypothetical protein